MSKRLLAFALGAVVIVAAIVIVVVTASGGSHHPAASTTPPTGAHQSGTSGTTKTSSATVTSPATSGTVPQGSGPSSASTVPVPVGAATSSVASTPQGSTVAVISVDAATHNLTIASASEMGQEDTSYSTCPSFSATGPSGKKLSISHVLPGDFATESVDTSANCLSSLTVLTPPAAAQCQAPNANGGGTVTWEGSNTIAHTVIYTGAIPGGPTQAVRWCSTPKVVNSSQASVAMSSITSGTNVTLSYSTSGFVTSVMVDG